MQAGLHLLCPLCWPCCFTWLPGAGQCPSVAAVGHPWCFCRAGVSGGAAPFFLSCDCLEASLALAGSVLGVVLRQPPSRRLGRVLPLLGPLLRGEPVAPLVRGGLGAEPSLRLVSGPRSLSAWRFAHGVRRRHLRVHPAWSSSSCSCADVPFSRQLGEGAGRSTSSSLRSGPVLCALGLDGARRPLRLCFTLFPPPPLDGVPPTCPRPLSLLPAPACRGAVPGGCAVRGRAPGSGGLCAALLHRPRPRAGAQAGARGPPGLRGHSPGSPAPAAKHPAAWWAFRSPLLTPYFLVFPFTLSASLFVLSVGAASGRVASGSR